MAQTPELVREYPENIILPPIELSGRKNYDAIDIANLAADIHKRGQDTPVKVRKNKEGKYVLVFGRCRYLAVQYINEHLLGPNDKKVKLEATYEAKMSDIDALIAAIRENLREEVNDMDTCENIHRVMKLAKYTFDDMAGVYFPEATTGKAKADALRWVKERAALVELTDEAAAAVRNEEITITGAKLLAKLNPDEQREAIAENKSVVAGKTRIRVSDVKAKAASKPASAKASAKKKPSPPALSPAKVEKILQAAETMACNIEFWYEDATDDETTEKQMVAALNIYRKLVPVSFRQAEGKAA